jgi:hypothetical protein
MVILLSVESCNKIPDDFTGSNIVDSMDGIFEESWEEPINITEQAISFASVVIQTYWRGYACREKQRQENKLKWNKFCAECGIQNEASKPCEATGIEKRHTRESDFDVVDTPITLEKKESVDHPKMSHEITLLKSDVKYGTAKPTELAFNKKEGRALTNVPVKRRTVKKVSCVSIHFDSDAVSDAVKESNSLRSNVKSTLNQRCSSSQSHRKKISSHSCDNEKKVLDGFTARPPRPITAGSTYTKIKRRDIQRDPSSACITSGSVKLENAINTFLKSRETIATVPIMDPSIVEPREAVNKTSIENSATKDRFDALLSRLRSLNA